jgi:hypothetical protein
MPTHQLSRAASRLSAPFGSDRPPRGVGLVLVDEREDHGVAAAQRVLVEVELVLRKAVRELLLQRSAGDRAAHRSSRAEEREGEGARRHDRTDARDEEARGGGSESHPRRASDHAADGLAHPGAFGLGGRDAGVNLGLGAAGCENADVLARDPLADEGLRRAPRRLGRGEDADDGLHD